MKFRLALLVVGVYVHPRETSALRIPTHGSVDISNDCLTGYKALDPLEQSELGISPKLAPALCGAITHHTRVLAWASRPSAVVFFKRFARRWESVIGDAEVFRRLTNEQLVLHHAPLLLAKAEQCAAYVHHLAAHLKMHADVVILDKIEKSCALAALQSMCARDLLAARSSLVVFDWDQDYFNPFILDTAYDVVIEDVETKVAVLKRSKGTFVDCKTTLSSLPPMVQRSSPIGEDHFGSKEHLATLASAAVNNGITLTLAIGNSRELAQNLIYNAHYVVVAAPEDANVSWAPHNLKLGISGAGASYGQSQFFKIQAYKPILIQKILNLGYHVTWVDSDIVLIKHPEFGHRGGCDIYSSQDSGPMQVGKDCGNHNACAGFVHFEHTNRTLRLVEEWVTDSIRLDTNDQCNLQRLFTNHLRHGTTKICSLPDDEFVNGWRWVPVDETIAQGTNLCSRDGTNCITNWCNVTAVHANYLVGHSNKIANLKKHKLWGKNVVDSRTFCPFVGN